MSGSGMQDRKKALMEGYQYNKMSSQVTTADKVSLRCIFADVH
jgi:hypothetical protein